MEAVESYIRNIAVYIIFATVLEIVLPDNKFKEYINLVTGLILIYIIAAPLGNIINVFQVPSALAHRLDKSIIQKEQAYYEEKRKELILEEYKKGIYSQLELIVGSYYTMLEANINVSAEEETLGEIININIVVAESSETKRKLIRIEKIAISETGTEEEAEEIKKLKNTISDFYNLSASNIHITVQKKDR